MPENPWRSQQWAGLCCLSTPQVLLCQSPLQPLYLDNSLEMESKEPTPSEDPIHDASISSASPNRGDDGGGTQRPIGNGHDVFLNCVGKSISESFSNNLHYSLVDAGMDTFYSVHQSGSKMGRGILGHLMRSKISIPIFSPYYAFNKRALFEVVHMLKCKRWSRQIVLPIFYGVSPSQVQRVEGRFRQAFSRYKLLGFEKKLGEWRAALVEVGSLRGWATENFAYGNEGALIKLVVTRVVSLLKRTFKLPKELVGIDDHVKSIMSSIDPKYNDTRIVGICGEHGSGKTTLAKILCNNLSVHFEHLSFIPNIREVSLHMGIEYLQEELIYDILKSPLTVSNVDEGIKIITSQFTSKKVLIIFDDMDNDIHLNALVGDGSWLKAGSRVIITTRKMSILDNANADPKCELNHWTEDQALTLFSRHLFGKDSPPEAYRQASREVVLGITRIPLILEPVGSSFRQRLEKVWKDTFMKLKDDVNNKKDQDLLRIDYECLDYEQQQIFLDIACFFIGSSKQQPTYMWDSCDLLPKKGIEVLRDKFLIEIDEDDKLKMCDQRREFGRKIVRQEHQKELQWCSRLWNYEEAQDVLEKNKGTEIIQAICLDECNSEKSYKAKNFRRLTNLRFLKICCANFEGNFENKLSELRWLHWEHCPSNFVAANFHLTQLVVLNLSSSEISEDWGGWAPIKETAKKLKVLNLSHCSPLKRTPDLSTFESLEILILEKCKYLEKIDLGGIKSLISLNVGGCGRVEKLPDEVGRLKELKELLINDTAIREIPIAADGFMELETLNASCCGRLEELPAEVGRMKELTKLLINDTAIREIPMSGDGLLKLKTLNASCCGRLKELPAGVGRMEELRELLINDTSIQEIPTMRGGLKRLKTLCASHCEELAHFPESMGSLEFLTQLDLSHSGIEELPESMVFPKSLTQLNLSYSWIEKLPISLDSLDSLTQLDLSHSGIREFPKSLSSLVSLTRLDLSHSGIEELPESIGSLRALSHLNLSYLQIKKLPESLKNLGLLTQLDISHSRIRGFLECMSSLRSLTQLDLSHLEIEELPEAMGSLKALTHLNLSYLGIKKLPKSLNSLVLLNRLDLSHSGIREFSESLSSLTLLTQLDLSHTKIEELPESMDSLKALTHLNLSYLRIKQLLESIGYLESLQHLLLQGCYLLRHLPNSIRRLTSLTKLDLQSTRIAELPHGMQNLKNLKILDIRGTDITRLPVQFSFALHDREISWEPI